MTPTISVCPTGTTPVGDGFQCSTGSAPTCATGTPSGDNCVGPSEDGVCPTGTTPVGDGFQCRTGSAPTCATGTPSGDNCV